MIDEGDLVSALRMLVILDVRGRRQKESGLSQGAEQHIHSSNKNVWSTTL